MLAEVAEALWVTSAPAATQRVHLGRHSSFPLLDHQLSSLDTEIFVFVSGSRYWSDSSLLSRLIVQESSRIVDF